MIAVSDETAPPLASALVWAGWSGSGRRVALPNGPASGSVTPFVDRRAFIGTLTGGLLTAPLAAEAQPARRLPQLCVLTYDSGTARSPSPRFAAFFQGPQDLGYLSERTIAIQYLSADGRNERFSELVAECLRLKPDIIVVTTTPAAQTAKTATSTVPIVMVALGDLQGTGLVDSLARPGGHVTDMSQLTSGLAAKRLALLKEPVPRMSRVLVLTFLVDPIAPLQVKALKEVAPSLGVSLLVHDIRFNTTLFNRRL